MKKIATGLLVATALVSLSACNKKEEANNTADAAATANEVDANAAMADTNAMAANDTNAAANAGDANTANGNGLDEHGTSGGH